MGDRALLFPTLFPENERRVRELCRVFSSRRGAARRDVARHGKVLSDITTGGNHLYTYMRLLKLVVSPTHSRKNLIGSSNFFTRRFFCSNSRALRRHVSE